MSDPSSAIAWLRQTAASGGAVARVGAVAGAERARPVDPARATDPRWTDWPRPDPARIAIGDITQFQGLVYGLAGRPWAQAPAGPDAAHARPTAAAPATPAPPAPQPHPLAPPADQIAFTLQHLRSLRGL